MARRVVRTVAALRAGGHRVPILDPPVAATEVVEQIPVVHQDGDYQCLPEAAVIRD